MRADYRYPYRMIGGSGRTEGPWLEPWGLLDAIGRGPADRPGRLAGNEQRWNST